MNRTILLTAAAIVLAAAVTIAGVVMIKGGARYEQLNASYNGHGGTFKNTLAEIDTPDPSIVYMDGFYYMTFTHNGADIMVMKSRTLDFKQAQRKVVWYPPVGAMYSANLWAPEIQFIRGKWYIYFAADDGRNENHRMYALQADTEDPMGTYTFKGQITDETNKWAIDGLVLEREEKLYFVWSGWEGDVNIAQNTYIAPMSDPLTISGPRVLISEPKLEWERAGGPPYINEGHSVLRKDGRVFIVYSGAGSWTPFYSLGMLTLETGADPLNAADWKKSEEPILAMSAEAGVYGPGHNTFVTSPDGKEDWIVYHATSGIHDGWNNRKARAQRIEWSEEGTPKIGAPLSLETAIRSPSGTGVFMKEHAKLEAGSVQFDLIPSSIETLAPILIHYRNAMGRSVMTDLSVNGSKQGTVELKPTSEDETGYAYAAAALREGQNSVALSMSDGQSPTEILAIELPRYEAEYAQTGERGETEANPYGSGGGVVQVYEGEGTAVTFAHVSVPDGGAYRLIFGISNFSGQDQQLGISINQGKWQKVAIPQTERNIFVTVELTAGLNGGENEIIVGNSTGAFIIDYMDVMK
jgi:GH43 family beta-xylosidase